MKSRTTGTNARSQDVAQSSRKSLQRGQSNMNIVSVESRNSSTGRPIKITGAGQRPLAPKSDYEKFYESVFLADDLLDMKTRRKTATGTKRPLLTLLNDEDSRPEVEQPLKIPVHRESSSDFQPKDECIRQINGSQSPTKRSFFAKARNFSQRRHDTFNKQLYTKTERHVWKKEAIQMFLQLWAQHLKGLRSTMKNSVIYRAMEKEMSQFGPSHFEIKTKMDNMSRKYRLEAEKVRQTGEPSNWEYFHRIQSLLIGTKSVDVFEEILFENAGSSIHLSQDMESEEDTDSLKGDATENPVADESHNIKDDHESSLDRNHMETSAHSPIIVEEPDDEDDEDEVDEEEEEHHLERPSTSDLDLCAEDRSKTHRSKSTSVRMLEIEEEKLEIEREKLKVMKDALTELTSFHKDLIQVLRLKKL
ncbi:hypothetical protein KR009_005964 [Drosophila setifemur]|nr:hypothetical protein KR009_005964 [Drosophila setifemur]